MSHEIRTPLNGMIAVGQLLAGEPWTDSSDVNSVFFSLLCVMLLFLTSGSCNVGQTFRDHAHTQNRSAFNVGRLIKLLIFARPGSKYI